MSIFKKLQDKLSVQTTTQSTPVFTPRTDIKHEFRNFENSYRIGILCYYTDYDSQEVINKYKKELERLGYECDVLMFIDSKEKENNIYLQSYTWDDIDKRTQLPHSPRTDRFMVKRYDLLFNLFLHDYPQLSFVSCGSQAKCRVGIFRDDLNYCSDILIPIESEVSIEFLIQKINETLKIRPYERKQI